MIRGERIRQVRELNEWTQKDLAQRLGVTQPYIAQVEQGVVKPSEHIVDMLVLQTGFPPTFFHEELASFPEGSLLFRSRASASAKRQAQARQLGSLGFHLATRLAQQVTRIQVRLPKVEEMHGDPVTAARYTRSMWGLPPDTPIPNVINAAEKSGVLVLALPGPYETWEAFSVWAGDDNDRPVVVVTSGVPGDRLRLSVGHEIGHLVLHDPPTGTPGALEDEAYAFAAELLMPEQAMRDIMVPPITLTLLADLKSAWKVSIQALMKRARDLDLVTAYQYTSLNQQIARLGWRKQEPRAEDVPVEKPRALMKMVELLYGPLPDIERIASDACLPAVRVKEILELHKARNELVHGMSRQRRSDNQRLLTIAGKDQGGG